MKLSKNKLGHLDIPQYVIVNADDFGISKGTNEGIEEAYKKGIITSASIMSTGPAFYEAIKIAKRNKGLGVGVHLSLTWGRSILNKNQIPDLVDSENYFYPGISKIFIKTLFKTSVRNQVKKEFDAQIKKVINSGINPDHLNGQEHVHFLPYIFPIVLSLSKRYNIQHVRIPLEPLFARPTYSNFIKWVFLQLMGIIIKSQADVSRFKTVFFGILFTSKMDKNTINKILANNKYALIEILTHPGKKDLGKTNFSFDRQHADEFLLKENRILELKSAINPETVKLFKKYKARLTTFGGNVL